jgi:CubicO group peptidase (beta-lactamase class C family)
MTSSGAARGFAKTQIDRPTNTGQFAQVAHTPWPMRNQTLRGNIMVRKIFKGLGYLILALLVAIALFVAFNWTMVRNMTKVGGAKITDVALFEPAETVKGCAAPPLAATTTPFDAATFAAMKSYSDKQGGVGLIVLIDGKIAGETYRTGANAATRTSSMSMHKTVVAMMVGAAIRDGLIKSVDDPVGFYLDEWKDDPRGKITLRQLLTMASGLHNASMSKNELAAFNLMLGDVTGAALDAAIDGPPGTFNYNNVNPQIAGMALSRVLAKAGHGRYADYLSKSLWCPLGNANATLWPEKQGGEPRYFAYLDASVRDWAKIGLLIQNQGQFGGKQILPADWIAEMGKPSASNPGYGLLLWRGSPWVQQRRYSKEVAMTVPHSAPYLADDVLFLDGFGGQRVYVVPSAKLVIARSGEPSMTWDDAVLVNLALKGMGRK